MASDPAEEIFLDHNRPQHLYIMGMPGYGKSSQMHAMALQDMRNGHGITVLDPKAELVESLLHWIPQNRVDDVIYLSAETPAPLNIFAHDPKGRSTLAQDVYALFELLLKDLGERMGPVLKYTIHTLLHAGGCSLFDVYDFLDDVDDARAKILQRVDQKNLLNFWHKRFAKGGYFSGAEAPLLSRMVDFVLIPELRSVCGDPSAKLTMYDIVEGRKILLVNLASFGKVAAPIIGTLITSQIQQVILRRALKPNDPDRVPHFLYADEFHEFKNSAFAEILWKSRSFKLGLVLANQHPVQIKELIDDVKGCVTSYLFFQMEEEHARILKSRLGDYTPEDVSRLKKFVGIYRSADLSVKKIPTHPRAPEPNEQQIAKAHSIRNRMKRDYPCDSTTNSHNEGHGGANQTPEPKPDPQPQTPGKSRAPNSGKKTGH